MSININNLNNDNNNNNRQIQQTPRTKLNYDQQSTKRLMLNLIMTLDANQIDCIRNDFHLLSGDGANLFEFVTIMRKHVHANKLECSEDELLAALVELFDSMDLDGNHCLDFDEFLASIVHMGMGGADNFILDLIKPYRKSFSLRVTFSTNRIEAILSYVEVLDSLLCLELGSNHLSFYNPSNMKQTRQIKLENTGYIAIAYIYLDMMDPPMHYFLASTSQSIQIWDISTSNAMLSEEIQTTHPISSMVWSSDTKKLYAGDLSGNINVYSFSSGGHNEYDTNNNNHNNNNHSEHINITTTIPSIMKSRTLVHSLKLEAKLIGHKDLVTKILVTTTMELLISSSLDGTVRLWDLTHGEEKNIFEGHESGVVDIAYSNKFRFLFSAGMDHNIGVWSPFGSQKITLLKGHLAPLSAITCIKNSPRVISIDITGILRVWDARNFSCVQTLQTVTNMISFASCGPIHRRVAIASDSFFEIYDQVDSLYNTLGKEDTPFTVIYNSITHSVVTATRQEIRVYNSLTGKLSRVFRNLCWSEITAICFDHSRRKLIIGEHSGKISVFNFLTGNFMKSLASHSSEIIDLHNCKESSTIISVSRDNRVFIHDETPMDEQRVLLKLHIPENDEFTEITASCFSFDISLIAVATVNHNIYIWDIESGKFEGICKGHVGSITSLTFLGKFPFLASADDYGNVMIWYMRPSPLQYTCAIRFINPFMDYVLQPNKVSSKRRSSLAFLPHLEKALNPRRRSSVIWVEGSEYEGYCSISSLAFNVESEYLFTADVIGRIRKWPMRSFFQQLGTGPINLELLEGKYFGKTRRYSQILQYGRMYENMNRNKRRLSNVGELVLLPHEYQFVEQFQVTPRSNSTASAMSNGWVDAIGIAKILLVNDTLFCLAVHNDVEDIETIRIPLTCWSIHGTLLGALGTGYVRKDGNIKHQHATQNDMKETGDSVIPADKIEWNFHVDVKQLRESKDSLMKDIIKVGEEGHILDSNNNSSLQRYHQRLLRKHGYETMDLEETGENERLTMRDTINHLIDQGKRYHIKLRENQNHSPILASSITSFKQKEVANQGLVMRLAALEQRIKDDYKKRTGKSRNRIRRSERVAKHPSSLNRNKTQHQNNNYKIKSKNLNNNNNKKNNNNNMTTSKINEIVMAPKINKVRIEKLPKRKNIPYSYDDNSNNNINRKEIEDKIEKHRDMQRHAKSTSQLPKPMNLKKRTLLEKVGIRHSRYYALS